MTAMHTAPWSPLLIAVAPTGARRSKSDHPALPITTEEIAATAAACHDAGAAMIHLHVRDRDGRHLLDADAYREATAAVRRAAGDDMIIQVTSEAAGIYAAPQQMAVIRDLRPEAVSLAIKEIIPDASNEPEAAAFLSWLHAEGVMVQYILYGPDELDRLGDLQRRGVVPQTRPFVLFVLGRYTPGQTSSPIDLLPFLAACHEGKDWAVCAFGRWEHSVAVAAAALGGHCRVGFENNLQRADGTQAPDNAVLVATLRDAAIGMGRTVADGATARQQLLRDPDNPGLHTAGTNPKISRLTSPVSGR